MKKHNTENNNNVDVSIIIMYMYTIMYIDSQYYIFVPKKDIFVYSIDTRVIHLLVIYLQFFLYLAYFILHNYDVKTTKAQSSKKCRLYR